VDEARRNVLILATCQALYMTCTSLLVTITALVGVRLAPTPALATAPIALMFLVVMASTLPASLFMRRVGRRVGLVCGAGAGVASGTLACAGIVTGSFALFCVGMMVQGLFHSFGQYYRFAAADVASDGFKSQAISLVMAGGVVAAFFGPNLARITADVVPAAPFAGGFVTTALIAALCALVVSRVRIPPAPVGERAGVVRPMRVIAASPVFLVAVFGAMVAYVSMNLIMTATPLAMQAFGHPFGSTATVIQWHVVGMFAPSFVTGSLIQRFGTLGVMGSGAVLLMACVLINLTGTAMTHFWIALLLLGVGWNFLFVGGTTLLTEAYTPAEKAKTQGVNDLLVFSMVALSALSSGLLHAWIGWARLNLAVLPALALALLACLWLAARRRRIRISARRANRPRRA
jgi:MFS family permease